MKFRNLIISCVLAIMPVCAFADMTDQEILAYVAEQKSKGTSQNEMLQYLMKQGVTPQRLQQLKQKYKNAGSSSGSSSSVSSSRIRTSGSDNGGRVGAGRNGQNTQGRLMGSPQQGGSFDQQGEDYLAMQSAFDGFMSDSSAYRMSLEPEGPKVFGRDMFRNENISFEPAMNIATPGNYVLGPGDVVYIDVYGASQLSIEGTISPDGYIQVNEYGPLHLAGLTVEQADKRAKSKLGSCFGGSKIMLTVGQTRTIQVNVMGEVMVPGTYTLSAFATVFHALYSAGGVSDLGSMRCIKVKRAGKEIGTVDIYDYILNGESQGNIRLQDDDIILVPTYQALVNVSGKAKRPMLYEMLPSESVAKALDYAGGFASDAYTKSMRLVRKAGGQYQVFNVDEKNRETLCVADGDSIAIDSVLVRYSNMVELKGAVFHPGMYQLDENTKTVGRLMQYAEGTREDAFLDRAVIHRMRRNRSLEVVTIDLDGILNGTAADVTLQNEDVLFVPTTQDAIDNQTLTIRGEVYEPGIYTFAHNTTVEDLILQAGGLRESASQIVKVTRREKNESGETVTRSYQVSLSNGLSAKGGSSSLILQPFDEIAVGRNSGFREQRSVTVEGEVMFEGVYGIIEDNTRISEVISQAGGLSSSAATNGVFVLRKMNEEELRLRLKDLDKQRYASAYQATLRATQMQPLTMLPITDSLMVEREMREDFYKVAVDIQKVLDKPGCPQDLVLRDGDRIVVLPLENTVKISGAVAYEGTVPYVEGYRLKHYLRQGGIRASRNNVRNTYIVAQNGSAINAHRNTKVEPGSEIVLRERTQALNTSQTVSVIVSIASTMATMAAVVISVLR